MKKEILRMENVITENPVNINLDNFNLHMFQGEIMGLIELDALGKDVMIGLICKNSSIKYGRVYYDNQLVNSYRHSSGSENKVYVLREASQLINDLSVVDNVFVLRKGFKKYVVNPRVLDIQLQRLMDEIGVNVNPREICMNLSEYERCVVELLRAMIRGVKLIIVNHISNVLSASDLEAFKQLILKLVQKDYSILYIGYHHEDVFSVCDRVALMQEGKVIKVFEKDERKDKNILPFTISFEETTISNTQSTIKKKIIFKNISTGNLKDLSFEIMKGECVVLYDRNNKVPNDILQCLSGESELKDGTIEVEEHILFSKNQKKIQQSDITMIGENATRSMIFRDMSYIDNLCFLIGHKTNSSRISSKVKRSIQKEFYSELGDDLYKSNIRGLEKKSLYNLIYYRIYLLNPQIVFIAQPFSDADMYVRRHIIELIRTLKRKGIAVVILAVSISDSLYVADKLILIENGTKKQEYLPESFSMLHSTYEF